MAERFVSLKEVLHLVSLSRSQIYRLMDSGGFPKRVSLGPHRKAHLESEILAWMDARIAERESV